MAGNGNNYRRRPSRGRRTPNSPRRLRRAIDRIDYGVKFVPGPDPPEFSTAPWWPITLVFRIDAVKTFHFSDLQKALYTAFGVTQFIGEASAEITSPFEIRPQTIRVWGLAKQGINMDITEIIGAGTHRVKQLADMGSGINFSRLGWRYGLAANIDPNVAEDKIPIAAIIPNGKALVYIQVLFALKNGWDLTAMQARSSTSALKDTFEFMKVE